MSVTSKSPKKVLLTALHVARLSLAEFAHKNSPRKFSQHQLFACLVLKNFLKADYRGVVEYLNDCPDLCDAIELKWVPHYTTLQKAAKRLLLSQCASLLLNATIKLHLGRRKTVTNSAVDSTGLSATSASAYFVKRRSMKGKAAKNMFYHTYPKLSLVTEMNTHFVIAYKAGKGPRPDVDEFKQLMDQASQRAKPKRIIADAGYDSESNHRYAREELKIKTVIPPKHGRPSERPAKGRYRRMMQTRFDSTIYSQRAQIETVMSMLKRRQGAFCKGRTHWSRCRELTLLVLTHNVMILF